VVRACRRAVVPTGDAAADTADASRGRLTNSASLRSSRSDMHTTIAYDERRGERAPMDPKPGMCKHVYVVDRTGPRVVLRCMHCQKVMK
jgi:hypothetical protein